MYGFKVAEGENPNCLNRSRVQDVDDPLTGVFGPLLVEYEFGDNSGLESLLSDAFDSVSTNVKTGLQWGAGKAGFVAHKALKEGSTAILKALGARRMLLSQLYNRAQKDGVKESITIPVSVLKKATVDGNFDSIEQDLKTLLDVIKSVNQITMNMEHFYKSELQLFKNYESAKNLDDLIKISNELDKLTLPTPANWDNDNSMFTSQDLPGGKRFVFNPKSQHYSVETNEVSATETTVSFAKEELMGVTKLLGQVLDVYKPLSAANEKYASYIKDFNTVAGKGFVHLEEMKGEVSATMLNALQSRLKGNPQVFSYYSNFLPRVTLYIDDYVGALSSFLSKQIN